MRPVQRQRGSRIIKAQRGRTSRLLSLNNRVTFASVRLLRFLAGNQLQHRAHGSGHLRREFTEQVSCRGEPELNGGPLACVCSIVETGRKVRPAAVAPTKFDMAGIACPESDRSTKVNVSA
jgi:hypothetical protein